MVKGPGQKYLTLCLYTSCILTVLPCVCACVRVRVRVDMAVFQDCSVLLDLKSLPFIKRKTVQSAIIENGGCMSYVVNEQVLFLDSDLFKSYIFNQVIWFRTQILLLSLLGSLLLHSALWWSAAALRP